MSAHDDVAASRKLTDEEISELREIVLKDLKFSSEEKEDVEDLLDYTFAMVSNSKAVGYVVHELVSMEMDVCKQDTAHGIGKQIAKFLVENVNRVQADPQEQKEEPHKVASTKSTGGANALTMSGALGAARKGEKKPDQGPKKRDEGHTSGTRRGGDGRDRNQNDRRGPRGGGGRSIASQAFDRLSARNDSARGGRHDDRRQGSPGGREGDRLRGRRGEEDRGGGGSGGRGDMWRGGRGDTGRGRDSPAQRGRGGRGPPLSGNRRSRDKMRGEEDFIPAGGSGVRADGRFGGRDGGRGLRGDGGRGRGGRGSDFQNGRGGDGGKGRGGRGRDSQDGRGGDGRGKGGRGSDFPEANKRQRIDDSEWGQQAYSDNYYDEAVEGYGDYDEGYYGSSWRGGYGGRGGRGSVRGGHGGRGGRGGDIQEGEPGASAVGDGEAAGESWGGYSRYDEGYYASNWHGGYRGGRFGRGRGRGGRGRGVAEEGEPGAPAIGESKAAESAEGHPSPLVAATFGGDYGGRGFRGRGRDRGRGRGSYRAQVVTMIASKSWVRPKPGDSEGGDEEEEEEEETKQLVANSRRSRR